MLVSVLSTGPIFQVNH